MVIITKSGTFTCNEVTFHLLSSFDFVSICLFFSNVFTSYEYSPMCSLQMVTVTNLLDLTMTSECVDHALMIL